MKKYLLIVTVILSLNLNCAFAAPRLVQTTSTIPDYSYRNSAYDRDLMQIEDYLFGNYYRNDSTASRLNRIEKKLFGRNYSTMTTAQRMNNILANYRNDYNRNYLNDYYGARTPAQRILNRFIGQPTGFTPQIINSPFDYGGYGAGINRMNYTNRGYNYNNVLPASMGAGIHILD
ncbi:hypothetical protein IJ541_03395 [bacterium]|nr:hypothetical protein [bacterium]